MNDTSEFEDELRRAVPRSPSAGLEQRIATALSEPPMASPERRAWWSFLGFTTPVAALGWGFGAPAAAAVVILAMPHSGTTEMTAPALMPVVATGTKPEFSNVVYQAVDEGVVHGDGNDEMAHRMRYRSADQVSWRNPKTGAQWEVTYPREDVLLVPATVE